MLSEAVFCPEETVASSWFIVFELFIFFTTVWFVIFTVELFVELSPVLLLPAFESGVVAGSNATKFLLITFISCPCPLASPVWDTPEPVL